MKEIQKYTDVIRYGKMGTQEVLQQGDYISITEKLDGANASFVLDNGNEVGVTAYSRNNVVSDGNTLRGYYDWIKSVIVPMKDMLNPRYRYYGEWVCSHKIVYKPEIYNKFYLFSIMDDETGLYLSDEIVKSEADRLKLETTTYFYEGEYISFEHIMSFVGKSDKTLEPNTGEGVVVKNVTYTNRYGAQCFVKFVSEKFAEVMKQKLPKNPNIEDEHKSVLDSVVTKARVDKLIHKLVDEGLLDEQYGIEDMGTILRLLGNSVINDVLKEESEIVANIEDKVLGKKIGKMLPNMVKQVLKEQGRM